MDRYLESTVNMILDRSPEGLIGAILIALVLSLVVAGLYTLLHRRVSDASVLLTCLVLAANVAAMTIAGGYIQFARKGAGRSGGGPAFRDGRFLPGAGPRGPGMAGRILIAADANNDGVLSAEEATAAATRFVEEVGHGKPIDEETLRGAIRERLAPPGFFPPGPAESNGRERLGSSGEPSALPPDRPR